MKLIHALSLLEPENDEHWTSDGLPRMDALVDLTGDKTITRKNVTDAGPAITRSFVAEQARLEDEDDFQGEDNPQDEDNTEVEETPEDEEPEETPEDPEDNPEPEEQPQEQPEELEEPVTDPAAPPPDPTAPCEPGKRGPLVMEVAALDLPVHEVMGDRELTDQAIREIATKVEAGLHAKKTIEAELAQLYAKNEILKRQAILHERKAPKKTSGVKAYLDAQAKAREVRAKRALAYIEAGTTAKDVAAALRPGSVLDEALNRRKPARGSARPPARLMQRVS